MSKNNYTCGIDIGTDTIKVVVATYDKDNQIPSVISVGSSNTQGVRRGYITNIDQVSLCIKKALEIAQKNLDFKIKNAYVSIGGMNLGSHITQGQMITTRADQEVTSLDITKAIDNSQENLETLNKKIIQTIPLAYKLDGKEIYGRPEGMKGIKLEVRTLFITCSKQNIEDLVTTFEISGINILDVIPLPHACSMSTLNIKQKTAGCGLVDIGSETTSIAIYENNILIALQIFPIGSIDITRDIALGLKIDLDEAEKIKTGIIVSTDFPKKKVEEIINARLEDIFELISNYLKKIKRNELLPAGIVIVGGGSHINNIVEIAKTQLRLPARIGHIDTNINTNKFKLYDGLWYSALGLNLENNHGPVKNISLPTHPDIIKKLQTFLKKILSELLP